MGIASSSVIAVKAGRKDSGIDDIVWIGEAVADASNLSYYGRRGKQKNEPIVMSSTTYGKIIGRYKKEYGKKAENWFTERELNGDAAYSCNLVNESMSEWIEGGMKN